jgi:uncharacterized protein YegL
MPYEILATSRTPALIIYLLDISASMSQAMGNKRRIDVVTEALQVVLEQMVFRSMKRGLVAPRYRIGMFAYSDHVYDLLGGIKPIDEVANLGVPELSLIRNTDTAKAFIEAEKALQKELQYMQRCPAPLVCHMTDGEYTGADPTPIARRIMNMKVPDGNVLIENIFISEKILPEPIKNVQQWTGITPASPLTNEYAKNLRSISSPLPESYVVLMKENGYQVEQGAVMMLPGVSPELVEMGFVMSMSTPTSSQ